MILKPHILVERIMKMAKRRKNYTKKRSKRHTTATSNVDVSSIAMIIISLLVATLLYTKSGYVGQTLNEILGGMLGIIKYIVPIGTFLAAIKVANSDDYEPTGKVLQFILLIINFQLSLIRKLEIFLIKVKQKKNC